MSGGGVVTMQLRWVMLLVLFVVRLAMGFQFQSVASVSSHLVSELGFSYTEIGTLIGFFLLPGIFIAMPSGAMTRVVTDKKLLMAGAVAMIIGALVMGFGDGARSLFTGRLITGIGGTVFNVILTKMVTDWFIDHEKMTALAIMLTAWPIGISLGLLTQVLIADLYGWPWAMHATGIFALVVLLFSAVFYRDAPKVEQAANPSLRFGLPKRQLVHVSIVGIAWTLYNMCFIIFVSFTPDVLVGQGYKSSAASFATSLALWAMLISVPFGGRILEVFGWINISIVVTLLASTAVMMALSQGIAPEVLCIAFGIVLGIPAGALMALSAEAVSPDNRGPGLGIFYTWYYVGMTVGPALAGWTRDISGSPAAPVILGAVMLIGVVLLVGTLRILQTYWPIEVARLSEKTAI
jgi:predicted MFS family arabinose efflux permease